MKHANVLLSEVIIHELWFWHRFYHQTMPLKIKNHLLLYFYHDVLCPQLSWSCEQLWSHLITSKFWHLYLIEFKEGELIIILGALWYQREKVRSFLFAYFFGVILNYLMQRILCTSWFEVWFLSLLHLCCVNNLVAQSASNFRCRKFAVIYKFVIFLFAISKKCS